MRLSTFIAAVRTASKDAHLEVFGNRRPKIRLHLLHQLSQCAISSNQITASNGGAIGSVTYSQGNTGNIIVNSKSIVLTGQTSVSTPSGISDVTFGAGNAREVILNTSSLIVRDGGAVGSSTVATGSAGSITINAKDYIKVSGTRPNSTPSLLAASAPILSELFQQIYQLPPLPSGFSGDVFADVLNFAFGLVSKLVSCHYF